MKLNRLSLIFFLLVFMMPDARGESLKFPDGFQWCVATAGHQIEGDNIHSDWWNFEQRPGKIRNGDRSGKASYHMERLEEDVAHMKKMNVGTYRFSIEWSRIEPRQGEYDQAAIAYYHRELDLLKKNGIRPMVTLHHFVQPEWFSARGGWMSPDSADLFFKYTQKIEAEFGPKVEYWVSFNEPMVLLLGGYGEGFFAPGEKHFDLWTPLQNILKAHGLIYHYFHQQAAAQNRPLKMGMAHHFRPLVGKNSLLRELVKLPDFLLNWNVPWALKTGEVRGVAWKKFAGIRYPWLTKAVIENIKNTQDFLGVNYYTRELINLSPKPPFYTRELMEGLPYSELKWSIDPEGFFVVFKRAHELFPQVPFFVTENGLADAKDQWRSDYLTSHLMQVHRTINELKHPVIGYCHWSLMDNFEWQEGFEPRFGLIEVDYTRGGERKWRPSAFLAQEIFRTNEVPLKSSAAKTAESEKW